jgi:hypothetical protein
MSNVWTPAIVISGLTAFWGPGVGFFDAMRSLFGQDTWRPVEQAYQGAAQTGDVKRLTAQDASFYDSELQAMADEANSRGLPLPVMPDPYAQANIRALDRGTNALRSVLGASRIHSTTIDAAEKNARDALQLYEDQRSEGGKASAKLGQLLREVPAKR